MRELELIAALENALGGTGGRVLRGPGDDASVVRGAGYAVTSVDAMVDGVHFHRGQLAPAEIGHRALAAALSDLAAMGAHPGEAYLLLGLPPADGERGLAVARGAQELASQLGVRIAGGDVTEAPALTVSFTVVGWSPDPGALIGRDGARPGDLVAVTGALGGSGAGLSLLQAEAALECSKTVEALRARYALPMPRLREGRALAVAGARAMIDLSDGLASDAGHLARRSGVKIELWLDALPLSAGVADVAGQLGLEPREFAATAGEDYELCACIAPEARDAVERELQALGPGVSWIGQVSEGGAGIVWDGERRELSGYEHGG